MEKEYKLKEKSEIFDCEEGKEINLHLMNGEIYTGIFHGLTENEDEIMLKATDSDRIIGLKYEWIDSYSELID